MNIDFQDRIDEYVLGRMSDEDKLRFESEIGQDEEKKEQLELTQNVRTAISSRQEKLAALAKMKDKYEEEHKSSHKKIWLWMSGIAAVFVVGFFVVNPFVYNATPPTEIQRGDDDMFCPDYDAMPTDTCTNDTIAEDLNLKTQSLVNRIVTSIAICLFFAVQAIAQSLTEEEVSATMFRAFELNKEKNYKETLDAFLIIGKNTEKQRTAEEHQVYICSQTMAMACYELTGRYEEGYLLGKKLIAGKLEDNEKKDVYHQFVLNGYLLACDLIKRGESGKADYPKGREILLELVPYADEQLKEYVLSKIPLTWYFEGSEHMISQRYNEALRCLKLARKGFHDLGLTANEISAIKEIAAIKNHTYDILGSIKTYNEALLLTSQSRNDKEQMAILAELHKLYSTIGDMEQVASYTHSMDSLADATTDQIRLLQPEG